MFRYVVAIGAVLSVAACVPAPYGGYESAGADPTCRFEAISRAGGYDNSYRTAVGSGLDMAMRRQEIYNACMEMKGYQARPTAFQHPEGPIQRSENVPCKRKDGYVFPASAAYCADVGGEVQQLR